MTIDRNDFNELLARKEAEQSERLKVRERVMARQAKVNADKLTGDPQWDKFLSYLQPLLEDAQKVMMEMGKQIFRHDLSAEGVTLTRIMFAHAQGRHDAIREIMDVPKQLSAEYEEWLKADKDQLSKVLSQ